MKVFACLLVAVVIATILRGVEAGDDVGVDMNGEQVIDQETASLEEVLPVPTPPLKGLEEATGTGEDSKSTPSPSTPHHCGSSLPDGGFKDEQLEDNTKSRSNVADWIFVFLFSGALVFSVLITSLFYKRDSGGDTIKDHTGGPNYHPPNHHDQGHIDEEAPPKYSEVPLTDENYIRRESLLGLDQISLGGDREGQGEEEESFVDAKDGGE